MTSNVYPVNTKSGIKKNLQETIAYVTDLSKVSSKKTEIEKLNFLTRPEWRKEFVWDGFHSDDEFQFTTSYHCTRDDFIDQCLYLKNFYLGAQHRSMDNGPVAWHVVISWPENASVSNEDVFRISCEIISELGPYPAILGAHIEPVFDKKSQMLRGVCKHTHILLCAYPDRFDQLPYKLDFGKNNSKIRVICDRLAILNGQEIIVNADLKRAQSYPLAIRTRAGTSWVQSIRTIADEAAEKTDNMKSYRAFLKLNGIELSYNEEGQLQYRDKNGHEITASRLGRPYTKESLALNWDDRRGTSPRTSGEFLHEYAAATEFLHAAIPLGGIPSAKNKEVVHLPLKDRCCEIPENVLQSFFTSGLPYEISDENKKTLTHADGRQVLDYLGATPLDVIPPKKESSREHFERLKIMEKRLNTQIRNNHEELSDTIRCKQNFLTRERENRKKPRAAKKKYTVQYDASRRPDGSVRTTIEWLLLLLCSICIPFFNINKYSYKTWVTEPSEPTLDLSLQREVDFIRIWAEENISSIDDLNFLTKEASTRYWKLLKKQAAIELELSDKFRMKDAIEIYFETEPQLRKIILEEDLNPDQLREKYGDLCRDYDLAIMLMREYAIETWNDIMAAMDRYEYLKEAKAELTMAVSAQFERQKKLRFLKEYDDLTYYKNLLASEEFNQELQKKYDKTREEAVKLSHQESRKTDERTQKEAEESLLSNLDEYIAAVNQRKRNSGSQEIKELNSKRDTGVER